MHLIPWCDAKSTTQYHIRQFSKGMIIRVNLNQLWPVCVCVCLSVSLKISQHFPDPIYQIREPKPALMPIIPIMA